MSIRKGGGGNEEGEWRSSQKGRKGALEDISLLRVKWHLGQLSFLEEEEEEGRGLTNPKLLLRINLILLEVKGREGMGRGEEGRKKIKKLEGVECRKSF